MTSRRVGTALAVSAVAVALSLAGCAVLGERVELIDMRSEKHSVELDGAERVVVDLDMGVGKLVVLSGAESLMDAEFTYNVAEWKPAVDYSVSGGKGRLTITQPNAEGKSAPDKSRNEWELRLNGDVPLEIIVDMGVGEARLDLGELTLTDLSIDHGVGDVTVNLDGTRVGELVGSIDSGIGSVRLIVPSSVGVRIDGDTGIGSFKTHGLTARDGAMVNDAYDKSESTIELSIDAGIGKVVVETGGGTSSM